MPLDLPDGVSCFIDANIYYYHFVESVPFSDPCSDFLERVAAGAIAGFTSTHVLAEAMHKIMLAEVAGRFGLGRASLVNWLQSNRNRIAELTHLGQAITELAELPVICLPVYPNLLRAAAGICKEESLLTNDAISVALMRSKNMTHLVTNDDDFDDCRGIRVWKPR